MTAGEKARGGDSNPYAPPGGGPLHSRRDLRVLGAVMEVVVLLGGILCGSLLFSIFVALGLLPAPQDAVWVGAIGGPIAIGCAVVLQYVVELRADPAMRARPPVAEGEDGPAGALASVRVWLTHAGLALGGSIALALLLRVVGVEVEEQASIQELVSRRDSFELSMLALGAVALAPVVEELAFRHFLWRRLWWCAGPGAAYVVSALLFAAIHLNPVGVLTYAWLGLVFAHSYQRSGRIWVPVAVHATNNAVTLALLLAGGGDAAF